MMADTDLQPDDSPQSFVVRTWQESPGNLRGTVRHVQSQAQRGFTRLNQVPKFIEQNLAHSTGASLAAQSVTAQPVAARPMAAHTLRWAGLPRRKLIMVVSALTIVVAAGLVVNASLDRPAPSVFGSAVGQSLPVEVFLALMIGIVLGSLGTALWLRRTR